VARGGFTQPTVRGFACKVKNGYTNPYLSAVALYKCNASGKAEIIYCAEG